MDQQLEPGASPPHLVTISIGPNSTLQVDPNDRIDVFSNASFSFLVEGSLLQQQGPLSYIGLTKSDPFLKFIRNYAITLFKSGSMSQFIENKSMKRRKKKNTGANSPSAKNSKKNDRFKAKVDTVSINSDSLQENVRSQKVGGMNPFKLDGVEKKYTNTNDDAAENNKDEKNNRRGRRGRR